VHGARGGAATTAGQAWLANPRPHPHPNPNPKQVPPLLLGKPLLALRENRRKTRQRSYSALAQAPEQSQPERHGAEPSEDGGSHAKPAAAAVEEEEPEFEFMEVMVHQVRAYVHRQCVPARWRVQWLCVAHAVCMRGGTHVACSVGNGEL
jgi:hypothetical protein